MNQIILVIVLRRIKSSERLYASSYWPRKRVRLFQLADIGLCNTLLALIGVENCRTILRADIRPLTVNLGGIVHHRKCDLQNLAVGNGGRNEGYLYRFRVARDS